MRRVRSHHVGRVAGCWGLWRLQAGEFPHQAHDGGVVLVDAGFLLDDLHLAGDRRRGHGRQHLLGHSYWQGDFVGAGPFKMQSWVEGSDVTLAANDSYVLGQPKIDQIAVRFFTDKDALIAALLSGDVQLPLGRGLGPADVPQDLPPRICPPFRSSSSHSRGYSRPRSRARRRCLS